MKKTSIIALVVIAVAVAMIISTIGDASTYVSFNEAKELAQSGEDQSIHVVGELMKDTEGKPVGMKYEPAVDPNRFEFMMKDSLQNVSLVIYNKPKPQDMDKSEKVVVVGKMDLKNNLFLADQILLKCPSKYNNGELKVEEAVTIKD
jgi:cytochrome c-type biogenesis protein CcmE